MWWYVPPKTTTFFTSDRQPDRSTDQQTERQREVTIKMITLQEFYYAESEDDLDEVSKETVVKLIFSANYVYVCLSDLEVSLDCDLFLNPPPLLFQFSAFYFHFYRSLSFSLSLFFSLSFAFFSISLSLSLSFSLSLSVFIYLSQYLSIYPYFSLDSL